MSNDNNDDPTNANANAEEGFQEPPEAEDGTADIDDSGEEFEEPQDELSEESQGEEDYWFDGEEDDEINEVAAGDDDAIVHAKREIEDRLCASESHASTMDAEEDCDGVGNILGVGYGAAEEDSCCALDVEPGAPVLNVYVTEPADPKDIESLLVSGLGAESAGDKSVPVNVIVTGIIEAQPHRFKIRPAPGGVSAGHFRITAGTLGCLARARHRLGGCDKGKYGDRRRRLLVLSNNHVFANSNRARCLDPILQPGPADGGRNPRDRIALLERWVPIRFGAGRINFVDCATGWAWPKRVRKELVYLSRGRRRFFRVSRRPVRCRRGMPVGKSGRTTQLTRGQIVDCTWSGWINYGSAGRAFFRDQMVIRGIGRGFSAGGDSGSLIWTWNRRRNPVGLLFAGGGGITIANKIPRVLRSLNIRLYT